MGAENGTITRESETGKMASESTDQPMAAAIETGTGAVESQKTATKESQKPEKLKFGPDYAVKFHEAAFIAEYNSLRGEIGQRLGQQVTLYQIAIAAFGLILGYALEKTEQNDWCNDIILICVYPLLAFLLSYAWAFSQTRICQIAQYLRTRERQFTKAFGLVWWENYIVKEPAIESTSETESDNKKEEFLHKRSKTQHGIVIFTGTQLGSIFVALVLLLVHLATKPATTQSSENSNLHHLHLIPGIFLILLDTYIIYKTFITLKKSQGNN